MRRVSNKLVCVFLFSASLAVAQTATVKVDPSRVVNRVSPNMYAAFAEMMAEDVKWGLTAEMVHDRSFEECSDYLGLPADWRLEPDERNDNSGAIKFEQTTEEAYPKTNAATGAPEHSLRVTVSPKDISDNRQGFSQGRLSIRAGQTYVGYVWGKVAAQNGYTGNLLVALEEDNTDGETYDKVSTPIVQGDWRKYSFRLSAKKTDRFAKLTFLFDGKGTLYVDQISLEPSDAVDEVRADSSSMIDQLHPAFLRWPGGNVAQDYHWRWGIGPRELRPTWINKAWANAPEPGDFGTDEYLSLCARLHIAPSITVNVDGAGATAEEAAAWVEYVNGPESSKYGSLRAANGHPAPYGVKQWELGNEIFGDWVRGSTNAETYARSAVRYAAAMRGVDPTIRLIAVGAGDDWNAAVSRIAGPVIDYLAIHDYTSVKDNAAALNPRAQMMGRAAEFEANHRRTAELVEKLAPGRNIKLLVNEWNLFYPADVVESMEGAVYASRIMNGFERDGDVVEANCISDLLNGWIGGIIQASRDRVYGTSQYYAVQMYRDHLGSERLFAEASSPELQPGVKTLDVVVTRSGDGAVVYAKLSNADREHTLKVTIDLGSFEYLPDVEAVLLTASGPSERNRFEGPEVIKPIQKTIRCSGVCTIELPADAVAVISFHKS